MICKNAENILQYNIKLDISGRKPGLSAMLRVKNEAEYIKQSILSIINDVNEVVVVLQGKQSDNTKEIVLELKKTYDIKLFEYPYDSFPNGPGHSKQKIGSVYERAYFYNWCLSKTTYSYAMKWDGDMIATAHTIPTILKFINSYDVVYFCGWEMVNDKDVSIAPKTASDPRVFKVSENTFYETGPYCEQFKHQYETAMRIDPPLYLHFKWAKSVESITTAWPEDWKSITHFKNLIKNKVPNKKIILMGR